MRRRLLVIGLVWGLLHLYMGARLLGHAGMGAGWLALAWGMLLLLSLAPFGAFYALRREDSRLWTALQWTGFTALGLSSILLVLVVAADVLAVRAWGAGVRPAAVSFGILVGAAALTAAGAWGARRPRVVRVTVPIAGLPDDLAVAPLADLHARYGKFFVSGNHEYYWDGPGWLRELERLGFSVLTNAHRVLRRGAGRLLLAGVTDRGSDPVAALAGAPESDVKVLLAHQPSRAFAARAAGFDLQLSGHTHGGQYFPFSLLVRLFQPFVSGLHRLEEMWLYVSRGTGYWGPPLRLGAPSEITLIELHAALQPAAR